MVFFPSSFFSIDVCSRTDVSASAEIPFSFFYPLSSSSSGATRFRVCHSPYISLSFPISCDKMKRKIVEEAKTLKGRHMLKFLKRFGIQNV